MTTSSPLSTFHQPMPPVVSHFQHDSPKWGAGGRRRACAGQWGSPTGLVRREDMLRRCHLNGCVKEILSVVPSQALTSIWCEVGKQRPSHRLFSPDCNVNRPCRHCWNIAKSMALRATMRPGSLAGVVFCGLALAGRVGRGAAQYGQRTHGNSECAPVTLCRVVSPSPRPGLPPTHATWWHLLGQGGRHRVIAARRHPANLPFCPSACKPGREGTRAGT